MRRWIIIFCPLIAIFILSGYGFRPFGVKVPEPLKVKSPTMVLFPQNSSEYITYKKPLPPFTGKAFNGFKEALAFKESKGDYSVVNTLGYLGKYQFGMSTLELIGVKNEQLFLSDPALQEKAFELNIARNKWILRRDIKRFCGKHIGGKLVTESGMLAAAHLAGPGNVKKYLRSFGQADVSDDYGTNIAKYISQFSGYDVSCIPAIKNARL